MKPGRSDSRGDRSKTISPDVVGTLRVNIRTRGRGGEIGAERGGGVGGERGNLQGVTQARGERQSEAAQQQCVCVCRERLLSVTHTQGAQKTESLSIYT